MSQIPLLFGNVEDMMAAVHTLIACPVTTFDKVHSGDGYVCYIFMPTATDYLKVARS